MNDEGAANPEGIFMLKMLAEDGDFESQKSLAYMYYEGKDINKNIEQSLFWSNVALFNVECDEEEMLTINSRIGYILMDQKDYEAALKKFKFILDSCKLDSKAKDDVQLSIADVYYCLEEDCKAAEIYEQIIEGSIITDDTRLYIYKKLSGIYMNKKDFKLATEILNKSTKLKVSLDGDILNSIGFANEMSGDFSKALQYYTLASEKNCDYANLNLGYMYENEIGVKKDHDKAFMYYEKGKDSLEEWRISRDKFAK